MKVRIPHKTAAYLFLFLAFLFLLYPSLFLFPKKMIASVDILGVYPPFLKYQCSEDIHNLLLSDQPLQFYPWFILARETIFEHGQLPLWNPYQEMGAPLWANSQNALLSINNIFFYILPIEAALTLSTIFKLIFAFWGMFLLLRLLTKDPLLSFAGSTAFALGGFMTVWLGHPHSNCLMWQGWLFWAAIRLFKKPCFRRCMYLSLFLFLSYFGGHVETSFHQVFYLTLFILFYAGFHKKYSKEHKVFFYKYYIGGGILSFFLAAIYFFPFIEYMLNSWTFVQRQLNHDSPIIPFKYILNFFNPDIFGNPVHKNWIGQFANYNEVNGGFFSLSLLVAFLPGIFFLYRKKTSLFPASLITVLTAFCFIYPVPFINPLLNRLPYFNLQQNQRMLFYLGFIGIILGVQGWRYYFTSSNSRAFSISLLLVLVFFILFASLVPRVFLPEIFHFQYNQTFRFSMVRLLVLGGIFSLIFLLKFSRLPVKLVIILFILIETGWFHAHYNTVINKEAFYPDLPPIKEMQKYSSPHARLMLADNVMPANIPTAYGIYDIRNYDALNQYENMRLLPLYRNMTSPADTYDICGSPFFNFLGCTHLVVPQDNLSKYDRYPGIELQYRLQVPADKILQQIIYPARKRLSYLHLHLDNLKRIRFKLLDVKTDKAIFTKDIGGKGDISVAVPENIKLSNQPYKIIMSSEEPFYVGVADSAIWRENLKIDNNSMKGMLWYQMEFDDDRFQLENVIGETYFFQNTHALSRAFVTNNIHLVKGDERHHMVTASFSPESPEIYINHQNIAGKEKSKLQSLQGDTPYYSPVKIKTYTPNYCSFEVEVSQPCIFVLSDSNYPGWQVKVNGAPAEIIPVQKNFRGVYLTEGKQKIEFYYRPMSFYSGLAVSLAAIAYLLIRLKLQKN